jgi:hypothetical protein
MKEAVDEGKEPSGDDHEREEEHGDGRQKLAHFVLSRAAGRASEVEGARPTASARPAGALRSASQASIEEDGS